MQKTNQAGSAATVVALVVLALGLAGAAGFGYWAFSERQEYKNQSDKLVAEAVAEAEKAQATQLKAQFDQEAKNPYKTYKSSATHGTITFSYPKTWSAYVEESDGTELLNGYFHPNQVAGTQSGSRFALRLELVSESYSSEVQRFDSQIESGSLTATPYVPPKMKAVADFQPGLRLTGEIDSDVQGTMVILKVRDKTLKISTQSSQFTADFDKIILANLTFSP